MATFDAAPNKPVLINTDSLIDEDVLRGIEKDMDLYDQISCVFLIMDNYHSGYTRLMNVLSNEHCGVLQFIKDNRIENWKSKVFEALCLMQNNEIVLNLGIRPEQAQTMYLTTILEHSYSINKIAKAFYGLFESLSKDNAHELLKLVYQELPHPDYETWPKEVSLELHLLWWIEKGLISISEGRGNLTKLLKILKQLGMSTSGVYQTLKNYDVPEVHNSPCHYDNQAINTGDMRRIISINANTNNDRFKEKYDVKNGLVVIFNQMEFTGPVDYEYRDGSRQDCSRIVETFEDNFGFVTKVHNDLRQAEIYSELDNLRFVGKNYDCVIVFILSHGTCGNIIASDGQECPIEEIKHKLCSDVLRNKPKVLVIQACQKSALRTDAPSSGKRDVAEFEDLLEFSSTIPGELSIRDPLKGTWFIRILCEAVIDHRGFGDGCQMQVSSEFKDKVARINGEKVKQVPRRSSTLAKHLIFPIKARHLYPESA